MNFCTYFDKNYLSRGIALYQSLLRIKNFNFKLYIVAFDEFTYFFLKTRKFPFIEVVSYKDFEDDSLKKIKNSRSRLEYLWTCTPSIILFFLNKYKLKNCTYLDADLYFYSDPKKILKEYSKKSILITSHNYFEKYDQTKTSGKYCVQFLLFNNEINSKKIIINWRNQCIKWCYNRPVNNKFGDQKYLDNWTTKYKNVRVIEHLGFGVAPWNMQRFSFSKNYNKMQIKEKNYVYDLIFFHFHDITFLLNNKLIFLSSYQLSNQIKNIIYHPYLNEIIKIEKKYKIDFNNVEFNIKKIFNSIKFSIKLILNFKNIKFNLLN